MQAIERKIKRWWAPNLSSFLSPFFYFDIVRHTYIYLFTLRDLFFIIIIALLISSTSAPVNKNDVLPILPTLPSNFPKFANTNKHVANADQSISASFLLSIHHDHLCRRIAPT